MIYSVVILIILGITFNELSKKYGLKGLTFKREVSKTLVEVEEEFEISNIIENNKILPVTFVQFVEKLPLELKYTLKADLLETGKDTYHKSTMMILPYQRIKRIYKVYFNKRGKYYFCDVDLLAGDFFGFSMSKTYVSHHQEIVVLPKTADLQKEIAPYGSFYGDVSVKRWIINDPTLIVGLREYTGYEPQKDIHWPSSLKANRLMVKQYDFTSDNSVMIILNIETSRPLWKNIQSEKIEKCISLTRAIIEEFENEKTPYGFVTNAQLGGFNNEVNLTSAGLSSSHYYNTLEALGRIGYDVDLSFDRLIMNLNNNSLKFGTYVIVTPLIFHEDIKYINAFSNTGCKVVLISLDDDNLDRLDKNIMKYVERIK